MCWSAASATACSPTATSAWLEHGSRDPINERPAPRQDRDAQDCSAMTALDLFRLYADSIVFEDKEAAWDAFRRAAAEWRKAGRHLSAAVAMERASKAGWGIGNRVMEAIEAAIEDCRRCVDDSSLDSLEALVAINLWLQLLRYYDNSEVRPLRQWLCQELADRLLFIFGARPEAVGFLVRGVILTGSLDGDWHAVLPDHVTTWGFSSSSGEQLSISFPSAFTLLRRFGDRDTLWSLVERFPSEFESIALRGWKLVLEAERATTQRADLYAAAADAFAADVAPTTNEIATRTHGWSGINVLVWAKHFRARAALARIPASREQAQSYVAEALEALKDTWSGLVNEETYQLHIAIKALGALVGLEDHSAIETAVEHLGAARWAFGESHWHEDMRHFLSDTRTRL